ncbi:hypothetical protein JYU34_006639 [Plutella xylostella]|uniref:Uncharacterized protein n=1 Tax=Plutella xylostella TaxID=51655 RepID=A0ABQ7QSK7_PLUXY|nr:hypothetical protein JYU34_006639 [Plutella xylostella]
METPKLVTHYLHQHNHSVKGDDLRRQPAHRLLQLLLLQGAPEVGQRRLLTPRRDAIRVRGGECNDLHKHHRITTTE